jgi:hypothetical protein
VNKYCLTMHSSCPNTMRGFLFAFDHTLRLPPNSLSLFIFSMNSLQVST